MMPDADSIGFESTLIYDLAIFSIGFESRSRHLVDRGLSAKILAGFTFSENRVFSFHDNLKIAESSSARIIEIDDKGFYEAVLKLYESIISQHSAENTLRVAIDISSFTRFRLACIVHIFNFTRRFAGNRVEVDYFYSPGEYTNPPASSIDSLSMTPVIPEFGGTLRFSSLPLAVVFGLGYEPQQAVGAYEMLEPSQSWAFRPVGSQEEYAVEIAKSNAPLLNLLPPDSVIDYDISKPLDVLSALESLVFSLSHDRRVLLLPMGPKIFALACLLISCDEKARRPAVWRIGQQTYDNPSDIGASGDIIGLRICFN